MHSRSDEDCLLLNVYVPETPTNELLPVIVWIHGGAYIFGEGTEPVDDNTEKHMCYF